MYEQLYEYLNNYLNDLLCGFRKAHSTQYVLSRLIQSLKKGLGNSGLVGTKLMDLSKAYDCLPHDLLIAKLDACGLDKPSLNLVNGYLRFRKRRKKLALRIAIGLNIVFLRDPLWGLYFLIILSIIFSYLLKNLIYVNLLTITHCSLVEIICQ